MCDWYPIESWPTCVAVLCFRLGVLSNFYISLMQTEADRFQDTVRLLKDYYRGMEGEIPDELNSNYIRLPLIEVFI